jgi:hypothetical protein
MLGGGEAFEVRHSGIVNVPIPVVNVTTCGNGAKSGLPNFAVKLTATA